jgi:hypothetical protein
MGADVAGTWTMYDRHRVKRGIRYRRGVQTRADGAGSRPSVIESSDPGFVVVPMGIY